MVFDKNNNLHVEVCNITGDALVPPSQNFTLKATHRPDDAIIFKFDSNGNMLAHNQSDGPCYAVIDSIAVTNTGKVYTGGWFGTGKYQRDNLKLGSLSLYSHYETDPWFGMLDDNFNWSWASSVATSAWSFTRGIFTDEEENLYVSGNYYSSATFGSVTLGNAGWYDGFIGKIDPNGNWKWVKKYGGGSFDLGWDICSAGNDTVAFVGDFQGTAQVGQNSLVSAGGGAWGKFGDDIVVGKLTTDGDWIWSIRAGGNGNDRAYEIESDKNGNLYICGFYAGTASFGGSTLISEGGSEGFISKISPDGNWLWTKSFSGTSDIHVEDLEVLNNGNLVASGKFKGEINAGQFNAISKGDWDVFIAELDSGR